MREFNDVSWMEQPNVLGDFFIVNNRRPFISLKDEQEKGLGIWLYSQTQNRKKCSANMADENIRNLWDDFKQDHIEHLRANEEIWYKKLEEVKMFMAKNKTRPYPAAKDKNEKVLGSWISSQLKNRGRGPVCRGGNFQHSADLGIPFFKHIFNYRTISAQRRCD